jgi:hypothetical protein
MNSGPFFQNLGFIRNSQSIFEKRNEIVGAGRAHAEGQSVLLPCRARTTLQIGRLPRHVVSLLCPGTAVLQVGHLSCAVVLHVHVGDTLRAPCVTAIRVCRHAVDAILPYVLLAS